MILRVLISIINYYAKLQIKHEVQSDCGEGIEALETRGTTEWASWDHKDKGKVGGGTVISAMSQAGGAQRSPLLAPLLVLSSM